MRWRARRRREAELEDEIRAHLAMARAERVAAGEPEQEAELTARREFGNVAMVKDVTRDMWGSNPFAGLANDFRYAARSLRRSPGFAAVALVSLALGIGASTAMFSAVHHLLIRPLPFPEPDRIVILNETRHGRRVSALYANFKDQREHAKSFQTVAGIIRAPMALTGVAQPAQLVGRLASPEFFEIFGVRPLLGRTYAHSENPDVVVLSETCWRTHFRGDPGVLGRAIRLNSIARVVIGVVPESLYFGGSAEFYLPLALVDDGGSPGGLITIARLAPGVSLEAAAAELKTIAANLGREDPATNAGLTAHVQPLRENLTGRLRPTVLALFGAVSFVLLIACANVANLLLARVAAREKEIAIRAALGASRWRIVRQLLCESFVLALGAGALGALLAAWGVAAIRASLPGSYRLMRLAEVSLPVLGFAVLASVASALVFGLLPARHAASPPARGANPGGAFRRILLASEVALAVVLAVGATLLLRSLRNALNVDLGFRTERMLTAEIRLAPEVAPTRFFARLLEELEALPGAEGATAVQCLPVDGACSSSAFLIASRPDQPSSDFNVVDHRYARVMGIRQVKGRFFQPSDTAASAPVAVINESAARRFFPDEDPVGRRIKRGGPEDPHPWREIVGVIADVRQNGPTSAALPEIFEPLSQHPTPSMWPVVRTAVPPETLANALREAARRIDPDVPVHNVRAMEVRLESSIAARRFTVSLVSLFTAIAVSMAAAGVFGVVAYLVNRRAREIGIRIALGARPGQILRSVLGEGLKLAGAGIAAGLAGSVALMRLVRGMLFGVEPFDPVSFAAVAAGAAAAALLASLVPALHATRVDPVQAVRQD